MRKYASVHTNTYIHYAFIYIYIECGLVGVYTYIECTLYHGIHKHFYIEVFLIVIIGCSEFIALTHVLLALSCALINAMIYETNF